MVVAGLLARTREDLRVILVALHWAGEIPPGRICLPTG